MTKFISLILLTTLIIASVFYWRYDKNTHPIKAHPAISSRHVLYWYDPMHPEQHFDQPGKSPFMDMDLVPKLADDTLSKHEIHISSAIEQTLGVRLAKVERIQRATQIDVTGLVGFDERDVAIVQARASGFVEKAFALAPGDIIHQGDAIVALSVPEWETAENEFLATQNDPTLVGAARERMHLAGIPEDYIRAIEKQKKPFSIFTLRAPITGVIQSMDIRQGMNVTTGQTLIRINGLSTVWLDASVPQALAESVHTGDNVIASLFSGHTISGKVGTILPVMNEQSRSVEVRVSLDNPELELRPGASVQVKIGHSDNSTALAVPTEAVIQTGKRSVVMVSDGNGRFVPTEVITGQEIGQKTIILSGLTENQQIASSGQFLIDSEANLSGVMARHVPATDTTRIGQTTDETDATIIKLSASQVTLKHGPLSAFDMPAMTMAYMLATPQMANGLKPGDNVHVRFSKQGANIVVEKIQQVMP